MNITLNKTDEINATITVDIVKADYEPEVDKSLKDLRKNAEVQGFRKGMAPVEFLRQKYGKSVLYEEINKIVSKTLTDYLQENNLKFLGQPLPSKQQPPIDFNKQEDFTFIFDIGLSPIIDVKLTKDDKISYYQIQVSDEMIDKQIEYFKANYGAHVSVEEVEDNDMVKGCIVELDENGEPKAAGIAHDDAVFMPAYMKNEEEKTKFINAKLHSTIVFNPYTAYDGNEVELSSFLKIKKEEVKNYIGDFSFEINEITRYKESEVNQELFDKVFGEGTVDSEAAFREKIKEDLARQLVPESDYRFMVDARKLLLEKASGLQFPDAFLKRWLLTDQKRTPESLEDDYPKILDDLKFHLIKELLIEKNNIMIYEEEMKEYAKQAARLQFAQYGISNLPKETLDNYAENMLKKKETYLSMGEKIFEDKLIKLLKEQVTLEPQEISIEEYKKLDN